jgi:outer membrane protein OmpA-like peptidoglycan-associated protein
MMNRSAVIALCSGVLLLGGPAAAQETNLLYVGEGTRPVVEPPSYHGWGPLRAIDDAPRSAWASAQGKVRNNAMVFEMVAPATFDAFEFDCTGLDGKGRGANKVSVEVSSTSKDAGFEGVLQASLVEGKAGQRFAASKKLEGRWVRLTVIDNHGDPKYAELGSFRGYGRRSAAATPSIPPISGTFKTNFKDFHVLQQGTAISGCYEYASGLFEGTIEGRVAKLTWKENDGAKGGPAVFLFSPDGKSFTGYFWYTSDKGREIAGTWNGTRAGTEIGTCPHWSGSLGGELKAGLASKGRVALRGILFDTDSARIRAESFPTLDEVVRVLSSEPSWSLTIEGHTDSTGTAARNQQLSEERARSVMEYLAGKGIAAPRLSTVGFGLTRPVDDNATELGRAQNRRVELVKR